MDAKELLNELQEYTSGKIVHMYVIERKKKDGTKAKDKPSQKYEYLPRKVDMSDKLFPKVKKMLETVIKQKVRENVEIKDYSVVDDTEEKIQTYNDLGKIAGFQKFLSDLGAEIPTIQSFEELAQLEKAWALCYGFEHPENNLWMYCIKKLSPRNIAIEQDLNTDVKGAIKNAVSSYFDTTSKQLKPLDGFSINIEPSIDMIYLHNKIYVFNKKGFEDITSLTDEFIELGYELVNEVSEINFITDTDHLSNLIQKKPAFRKKLIKAKEIGNIEFLKTCKNFKIVFDKAGKKLSIKFSYDFDGKITATNEQDAENIIQVISEYYKEGIFAGKVFETSAGRLKEKN